MPKTTICIDMSCVSMQVRIRMHTYGCKSWIYVAVLGNVNHLRAACSFGSDREGGAIDAMNLSANRKLNALPMFCKF